MQSAGLTGTTKITCCDSEGWSNQKTMTAQLISSPPALNLTLASSPPTRTLPSPTPLSPPAEKSGRPNTPTLMGRGIPTGTTTAPWVRVSTGLISSTPALSTLTSARTCTGRVLRQMPQPTLASFRSPAPSSRLLHACGLWPSGVVTSAPALFA
jgi:hypothetical protein